MSVYYQDTAVKQKTWGFSKCNIWGKLNNGTSLKITQHLFHKIPLNQFTMYMLFDWHLGISEWKMTSGTGLPAINILIGKTLKLLQIKKVNCNFEQYSGGVQRVHNRGIWPRLGSRKEKKRENSKQRGEYVTKSWDREEQSSLQELKESLCGYSSESEWKVVWNRFIRTIWSILIFILRTIGSNYTFLRKKIVEYKGILNLFPD